MPAPKIKRSDFSQGLVHLTRERYENVGLEDDGPKRKVSAFDVLKEIVTSGIVRASGNDGYIKGTQRAVCFSEIPLSAVHQFATAPNANSTRVRYRFYGVAISKKSFFAAGGRPVIYLPDSETDWIPDDQKWRVVRFEHGEVDFTHEREWRALGDLQLSKLLGLYLLVWSSIEAREILTLNTPLAPLIRGVMPMEHLVQLL